MSEEHPVFIPRFRVPRFFNLDLLIKVGSLFLSIGLVTLFYAAYVEPSVEQLQLEGRVQARVSAEGYIAPRSAAIIMKDPEQRWEITFWVWAMFLLSHKLWRLSRENRMLGLDYLGLGAAEPIAPESCPRRLQELEAALGEKPGWRERLLPNLLLGALHRFHATRSISDAAGAVKERADAAANEYEADLALVRYIAWAIPAIGFIGTVRGIGEALAQASKAIAGDITGVVDALGLAFNSTLVALLLAMPLMFLLFLVQGRQDRFFVDLLGYCDAHLIARMRVPGSPEAAGPV